MTLDFLPNEYLCAINNVSLDMLYEIRMRIGFPIMVNHDGKKLFLTKSGLSILENGAIICVKEHIDYVIKIVTEHSFYAFNDKIKQGFLTTEKGVRIGIAGECVFENDKIVTIKNISSLNIRIPHEIYGCSNSIINKILINNELYNSLLIAPPFWGKTTMLKDLSRNLDKLNLGDILIIDERGEFISIKGKNIDFIRFSDKLYAFTYALRSMSPNIVITDELSDKNDWLYASKAANSGVKIVASCHGGAIEDVAKKEYFKRGIFDRFVVLSNKKFGKVIGVYDQNLNLI